MNRTFLTGAIFLSLAGILFLIGFRYFPVEVPEKARWIALNQVERSAIQMQGQLYTLNYSQNRILLDALNTAERVKARDYTSATFPFSTVVIYRLDGSTIVLTPTAVRERNLVFQTPAWNEGHDLLELSGGILYETLLQAFDHAQVAPHP